ncbi:GntR family transcriptional regulator [Knoellia sp. p5-6-4]|uniref:GntR family transcriptional regulator n=1 Tax=unclassified Knoellia TaxID=2618719 RepID=UPI0023DA8B55|nr:GntR family transcriptional regulator [Knoellia sp. p5-6-4]MDF2143852.1 GntR family transcriptional regulator [Knoellia sp. p5-6-4]
MGTMHTAQLDRASGVPLWRQLHQDLLRRLAAGDFELGFPGEVELQREYSVSRHTVREALRRIREAGLIDSGRGRSTRVRSDAIEQPLGGLYSLFRQVEAQGLEQRSEVLTLELTTDPDVAARLERSADEQLVHLERVRLADGEPLAHDEVWLPASVAGGLLEVDFTRAGLYDELARVAGTRPTGGWERITAVAAGRLGPLLGVDEGAPCFAIERVGQVEDEPPLEYRRSLVRGDRYALLTSWTPRGYRLGARDL